MDFAHVDEVQRRPGARLAQQAHFVRGSSLLLSSQPHFDDGAAVAGDDVVDERATLDEALSPQPHGLGHGHDQPISGEPADQRVGVLAQERFSSQCDRLSVVVVDVPMILGGSSAGGRRHGICTGR